MRNSKIWKRLLGALAGFGLVVALVPVATTVAAAEQTFDMLQIGSRTYRNVTVTTKSKDYIFILHSAGMTNIKVAELSPELREKLGYAEPPKPKESATNATAWAKQTLNKLETSQQLKTMEAQVVSTWRDYAPMEKLQLPPLTPTLLWELVALAALLYFSHCYCCMLICQKAGQKPGFLVWLPVLQLFPLLRAAGMSAWWFLAWFVPLLNLLAYVLWCFNIAKARNKTAWVGLFLLLPVTSLLAFLYLALSGGVERKSDKRRIAVMAFGTA